MMKAASGSRSWKTAAATLQRRGAGQPEHRMLGRDVGADRGQGDRLHDRGDVDDRATLAHRPELRLQAVEDAVDVDVHHAVPGLARVLGQWFHRAADPGVVDRDVQAAVLACNSGDRRVHGIGIGIGIGHVDVMEDRCPAAGHDLSGRRRSGGGIEVEHGHPGAGCGESGADRPSEPATAAGHEGGPPVETAAGLAGISHGPPRWPRNLPS